MTDSALDFPRLRVRVVSDQLRQPVDLLRLRTHAPLSAWVSDGDVLVGWGTAWRTQIAGADQEARASGLWQALVASAVVEGEDPVAAPLTFGSFGFQPHTPGVLIVPEVCYVARGGRAWIVTQWLEGEGEPRPGLPEARGTWPGPGHAHVGEGAHSPSEYLGILTDLIGRLRAGQARKVVLARDVVVDTEKPVAAGWLAARLAQAYPTCWTYAVDSLVGATPEMLAEVREGRLFTRVLAGTAGVGEGDDLMRSGKDRREHTLALESVRRALEPLCADLAVPEQPDILTLPNVTHLASTVTGSARVTSLQAAAALHPTAAVCGTPTADAARMIGDLEGMDRGRYAGPVGWMDARGNGQWGIALRCGMIEGADARRVRVIAGGGIMPDSDPRRELAETEAKMLPVLNALGA
ncbi:MAG: chorismate-binding protein [Actinomycetaceae bacterium]|nr:chorismate-binding protein [Actinomycetaceae bacterium]MDU0970795.1 chorismate-binding protein [Actinomycetaceae bacterium]